jgi:hypothetical protein
MHAYEVRPRKDKRSVDLISDALPFGRLRYGEANVITFPATRISMISLSLVIKREAS